MFGWAACVAISQTIAAIGFLVFIVAYPFQMDRDAEDVHQIRAGNLDNMTASNEFVLVSLGGKPELPEVRLEHENEDRDEERGGPGGRAFRQMMRSQRRKNE